jgi:alkylhydroperoxidase/carboxymuconolactone decarboxylase family protein YurZ
MKKMARYAELAPEAFKAFVAFDEAVVKNGVIPAQIQGADRHRRRADHAVSLLHRHSHEEERRSAGASEQELAETALLTAALRAGGAVTHGTHTME